MPGLNPSKADVIQKTATMTAVPSGSTGSAVSAVYPSNYFTQNSTISTSGTATTTVKPDKVTVSVGVDTNGTTAQKAASANADLTSKILEALRKLGVLQTEISTTEYNVDHIYGPSSDFQSGKVPCPQCILITANQTKKLSDTEAQVQ